MFADDYQERAQRHVVGCTGSAVAFEAPYLRCSLKFWDQQAIDAIISGERKQLSCGYHYAPKMTPGIFEGERYDGVMTDIVGNHVALVELGRAGPDVVVGDALPAKHLRRIARCWWRVTKDATTEDECPRASNKFFQAVGLDQASRTQVLDYLAQEMKQMSQEPWNGRSGARDVGNENCMQEPSRGSNNAASRASVPYTGQQGTNRSAHSMSTHANASASGEIGYDLDDLNDPNRSSSHH